MAQVDEVDDVLGDTPVEGVALFCFQFKAMLRKNVLLTKRNVKDLLREIIIPCIYLTIMIVLRHVLVDELYEAKHDYPVTDVDKWYSLEQQINWNLFAHSSEYNETAHPLAIAYAHETANCGQPAMESVMEAVKAQNLGLIKLPFTCFNSSEEMEKQEEAWGNIYFGVVFASLPDLPPAPLNEPVRYRLRMNHTLAPAVGEIADTAGSSAFASPQGNTTSQFTSGLFLAAQHAVGEAVLSVFGEGAGSTSLPPLRTQRAPTPKYSIPTGTEVLHFIVPVWMTVLFTLQVCTSAETLH